MTDEERLDAMEKRLDGFERDLAVFQADLGRRLAEAIQLIQGQQKMREARTNRALRKVVTELSNLREGLLGKAKKPPAMN